MTNQSLNRRALLKLSGALALAIPILQACGGGAAAPTAAPAAAPPAAAPAAATTPTAAPAAAAAPAGGKISLSIATEGGPAMDYERDFSSQWAAKNPDVTLRIDTVAYAESQQKTMTGFAAGTLQDVVYASCKWFPLPADKGAYRAIDDYVKANDPGLADFFPGSIANSSHAGKLYGLPNDFDNGNYSIDLVNLDIFAAKGVTPPDDNSDINTFIAACAKVNDPANKVYGTDYYCGQYYDFCQPAREWGTDILSKDGTKFQFANDPLSTQAAQWLTDIRVKYKAAPLSSDLQGVAQGVGFASGKLATSFSGINGILQLAQAVGNKFKWAATLFPKHTNGNRSFYLFSSAFCITAKSPSPDKAYDLIAYATSKDAGVWGLTHSHGQGTPRFSVMQDPTVLAINPVYPRILEWFKSPAGATNFPLPANLDYAELQTAWSNTVPGLWYGDVPFDQAIKAVQDACQAVLDKPKQ